jgi:hypothetical protein
LAASNTNYNICKNVEFFSVLTFYFYFFPQGTKILLKENRESFGTFKDIPFGTRESSNFQLIIGLTCVEIAPILWYPKKIKLNIFFIIIII